MWTLLRIPFSELPGMLVVITRLTSDEIASCGVLFVPAVL